MSRPHAAPGAGPPRTRLLLPLLAVPALVLLISGIEAPMLLGGVLTALALAAMLLRPHLATLGVAFLLYINAPAIAVLHGTPKAIAGAMILLLGIPLADRLILRHERARSDWIFGLMLAFFVVMLISSLGAPGKEIAFERLFTYVSEGLLLYWLFINTVTTRKQLRRVIWALLAAGTFLGSLSAYQAVTGSYEQQFAGFAERKLHLEYKREADMRAGRLEDRMYRADRAEGPQVGSNRYAQIMLVLVPLAFALARMAPTRRWRLRALFMLGIIGGAVVLTYSRGGIVGLGVLAGAAVFVQWLRPRHVLIGLVAVALALPIVAPSVFKRVATLGEVTELDDPTTDGSLRGRATEMLAAFFVFADHPVVGVGPGQYAPYYSVEYQQTPGIKFRDIQSTRRAHSLYIEMAAETGAVGLAIFLAIPLLLLRDLWRTHRRLRFRDPELAETAAAIWLGLIGFLFTALLLSHAFERYYWLLVALAGAALHIARSDPRSLRPGPEELGDYPAHPREWGPRSGGRDLQGLPGVSP